MTWRVISVLALCIGLGTYGRVRAELTAFWQHNPITPEAVADDPALAGMQSWSVIVANTDGLWTWAGMRAVLPAGSHFYRNALGGQFRSSPSAIGANPALEFHTYVTEPRTFLSGLVVLGGFPEPDPQSFGGPLDPIPGTFSVLWFDIFGKSHPPGTFEIARLTFPTEVQPAIDPESRTQYVTPDQSAFIPTTIPEPITLGAGSVLMILRRRHL